MFEGLVDFLCSGLLITPERAQFGTFLQSTGKLHDQIYIPNQDSTEYEDWDVFISPFSTEMWIAIILKCIIFSIFSYIIEWFHNCKLVRTEELNYLWNFVYLLQFITFNNSFLLRLCIQYFTKFGHHLYQILAEHLFHLTQIILHPIIH